MARNRVIYQSEALFVSPNATGAHYVLKKIKQWDNVTNTESDVNITDVGIDQLNPTQTEWMTPGSSANCLQAFISGDLGIPAGDYGLLNNPDPSAGKHILYNKLSEYTSFKTTNKASTGYLIIPGEQSEGSVENLVQQIHRVQSANYSFTINRTDVNEFGQLARIDSLVLEPPTVNLDFNYYPTDGRNESLLNFHVQGINGADVQNAAGLHLKDAGKGQNFFIMTSPEGTDAVNYSGGDDNKGTIALGNGYLSDWSIEASVGAIPSASATVELYNAKSDKGTKELGVPSVDLEKGSPITPTEFSLPPADSGNVHASALRPGDIKLTIPSKLSLFNDVDEINIQSFNLSIPLSRTPIDRIGSRFAFSRVVDFPVTASMTVNALVSELNTGNLANMLDDCEEHDVKVQMKYNESCTAGNAQDSLIFDFKGARIDSENITSDIGSNKSVDLTFSTQIGGPEDNEHGIYISGLAPPSDDPMPTWVASPSC